MIVRPTAMLLLLLSGCFAQPTKLPVVTGSPHGTSANDLNVAHYNCRKEAIAYIKPTAEELGNYVVDGTSFTHMVDARRHLMYADCMRMKGYTITFK